MKRGEKRRKEEKREEKRKDDEGESFDCCGGVCSVCVE